MEKASHKLNSIKLVSGNNSEPSKTVTDIRTKLSPEQEEQKENYHPFLQKKNNLLLEKNIAKEKSTVGKVASVWMLEARALLKKLTMCNAWCHVLKPFRGLQEPVYGSALLQKALEVFPPIICSEFSLYIFEQLS